MTTKRIWFPLFDGELLRKTMHLNEAEFGCYMRLIIHAYNHHGEIPTDPKMLAQITGAGLRRWLRLSEHVLGFFKSDFENPNLSHTRVIAELEHSRELSSKRSAAGKLGNQKRWGNRSQNATDLLSQTPSQNVAIYNTTHNSSTNSNAGASSPDARARSNGSHGAGSLSQVEQDRLIEAYERQTGKNWLEATTTAGTMSPEKSRKSPT